MEKMCVAHKLDVTDLQHHVQGQALTCLLQHLERVQLLLAESRDETNVGEPGQGTYIVRIPFAVHPTFTAILNIEDRLPDPFLLSIGHLSLPVEVPDRLRQRFGNIGVLALQCVPDVVYAHNVALPTLKSAMDTKKTDNICIVGVEELASRRPVDTDLVDLRRVVTHVLYMSEDMAASILRYKVADIGSETHVGSSSLFQVPLSGREALEEDEALAVKQISAQIMEQLAKLW